MLPLIVLPLKTPAKIGATHTFVFVSQFRGVLGLKFGHVPLEMSCFFVRFLPIWAPKNLLRLFFAWIFSFKSEVIFKDPPKRPFKRSIQIASRSFFSFFQAFFFLISRETFFSKKIASKDP